MANYQYTSDLIDDVLFRIGEKTDGTSDFDATALQYINRAYQTIWSGGSEFDPTLNEDWWFLRKDPPGTLVLDAAITTGTISMTADSISVTFSTGPTPSVTGRFLLIAGDDDVFRITAHVGAETGATIDAAYTGSTDGAASYTLFSLDYSLASDVMRIVGPMRVFQTPTRTRLGHNYFINGTGLGAMEAKYPVATVAVGIPSLFAEVADGKIRFNTYPSSTTKVEYDYLYRPTALTDSGSEEPIIPLQWRRIISDVATFFLYLDKGDDRTDAASLVARAGVQALAVENRARMIGIGRKPGLVITRPSITLKRQPSLEANVEKVAK